MHRSNNSSPYPLFERLFAVILSVTDFQEITFGGCIAEVIPQKPPALCETQQVLVHIAGMRRELFERCNIALLLVREKRVVAPRLYAR